MADGSSTNEGIQQYYVTKIEEHQVGMIQIDPGSKFSFVSISITFGVRYLDFIDLGLSSAVSFREDTEREEVGSSEK